MTMTLNGKRYTLRRGDSMIHVIWSRAEGGEVHGSCWLFFDYRDACFWILHHALYEVETPQVTTIFSHSDRYRLIRRYAASMLQS